MQTLLREKLFDRLDLWVHPIVLGVGKTVFDGGAVPTNLTLLEAPGAARPVPCCCGTGSPTARPAPAT
ncbi:dihydrofolate reductase family protein [Cellulosimicrobium sp. CUA-896]|uniref:dihydrofolate reductase family protein n=1 Tax=Cellulosimicrobium sp. CUA-896 TaxID=1517881 RepID=UPI000ACDB1B0